MTGFASLTHEDERATIGVTVRAEATLERVEGRRLSFNVSVNNERGLVAAGKVTRVLVNRERFMEKAQ